MRRVLPRNRLGGGINLIIVFATCIILLLVWFVLRNLREEPVPPPVDQTQSEVEAWLTTGDQQHLLARSSRFR
ncbi:hypothetical protein [Paenibacillus sp. DCT19]|uniref:hypothetical protein n=1 Tax=Paenibacillus sp. DCT19 TaxID=2211212 RepID=UPI000FE21154|nr:hypothetical protein [Paenibacillus sp. DCT19]